MQECAVGYNEILGWRIVFEALLAGSRDVKVAGEACAVIAALFKTRLTCFQRTEPLLGLDNADIRCECADRAQENQKQKECDEFFHAPTNKGHLERSEGGIRENQRSPIKTSRLPTWFAGVTTP